MFVATPGMFPPAVRTQSRHTSRHMVKQQKDEMKVKVKFLHCNVADSRQDAAVLISSSRHKVKGSVNLIL